MLVDRDGQCGQFSLELLWSQLKEVPGDFLSSVAANALSVSSYKDKTTPIHRIRILFFCFQLGHSQGLCFGN